MSRIYLDYNATTPLRSEAREAMLRAMDLVGNPSSVHAEGRAAKGVVERARAQVARLAGCAAQQVVFTGSATEAAAVALRGQRVVCAALEHESVAVHCEVVLDCTGGRVSDSLDVWGAQQGANSETGLLQDVLPGRFLTDLVQLGGKRALDFPALGARFGMLSAHKMGGPKGVGALLVAEGVDIDPLIPGGGQEMGRRSGTENVIGIAGFGAAAEAAQRDLADGSWDQVEKLRNILESALAEINPATIFVGKEAQRLPNTSCFITPGWRAETQVMQMDLAGYAISAGSACSSGKVKESRVLRAMGFGDLAGCGVRVSLGLETREEDVLGFVAAWGSAFKKFRNRAA